MHHGVLGRGECDTVLVSPFLHGVVRDGDDLEVGPPVGRDDDDDGVVVGKRHGVTLPLPHPPPTPRLSESSRRLRVDMSRPAWTLVKGWSLVLLRLRPQM